MDIATVGGLTLAWMALIIAVLIEQKGDVSALLAFLHPAAFIIVLGGTFGATLISFSMTQFKKFPQLFRLAMSGDKEENPHEIIRKLVSFAEKARREGLLVLEDDVAKVEDPFLQKGVQLVVDGTDPELVKDILETEVAFLEERHKVGESIFSTLGGFAPTLGIIGTVMGLVNMLRSLGQSVANIGPAIATAFLATFYGVSFANLIFLPIGNKLSRKSQKEVVNRQLLIEGILSIQAGDHPRIVEEKLKAFLSPSERVAISTDRERIESERTAAAGGA